MFTHALKTRYEVVAASTMTFWHGGNLDMYDDYVAHKGGRWEYGPGLYLITHYDTAKKYAKGSRKLYRVTVEKGVDVYDAKLPLEVIQTFINTYVSKTLRKGILERLQTRSANGNAPAFMFLNLMINGVPGGGKTAVKNTDTDKLRQFLVSNGIDYALVDNPFGWHEKMLVLFNMQKVVKKEIISPKDKIEVYDLPTDWT